jgi:MFS family permease
MESTATDGSPPLDEVSKRARRRLLLTMGAVGLSVAVGSWLLGPILNGKPGHRVSHHHTGASIALVLAIDVVIIAVCVAVLVLIVRKMWRNEGMFTAPLIGGLKFKQRRTVTWAVRHGTPSSDPTLAAVERFTAERIVKYYLRSLALFVVAVVLLSIGSVATETSIGRVFFASGAAMFVVIIVLQMWTVRGVRRYLETPPSVHSFPG